MARVGNTKDMTMSTSTALSLTVATLLLVGDVTTFAQADRERLLRIEKAIKAIQRIEKGSYKTSYGKTEFCFIEHSCDDLVAARKQLSAARDTLKKGRTLARPEPDHAFSTLAALALSAGTEAEVFSGATSGGDGLNPSQPGTAVGVRSGDPFISIPLQLFRAPRGSLSLQTHDRSHALNSALKALEPDVVPALRASVLLAAAEGLTFDRKYLIESGRYA